MRTRKPLSDEARRPIIGGFIREDIERLNRLTHAKNLRSVIAGTKWLNDHGAELLRRYPQEFLEGTGMTAEHFLHALAAHVDRCRGFLKSAAAPTALGAHAEAMPPTAALPPRTAGR